MDEEGVSKDVIAKMIETNNQTMMKSMEQLFQKSIDELKRSHVDSSDAQIREIKKLKMEEPRRFKKKANEDQFRFNAKIQDTLEETKAAAQASALDKIKDSAPERCVPARSLEGCRKSRAPRFEDFG